MEVRPWSEIVYTKLKEMSFPKLIGSRVFVGSDYSGDDGTNWWTASFVILSIESMFPNGEDMHPSLARLAEPPDYKNFRKKDQIRKIEALLKAFEELNGHLLIVGSQSKMNNLSFSKRSADNLKSKGILSATWNQKSFERAGRACHLLVRYLQACVEDRSIVEWYTDYDEFVRTELHIKDVTSIVNSLRQYYCADECGSILVNHIKQEEVLFPPKILCKLADLVAGSFNEKIRGSDQILRSSKRGTSHDVVYKPSQGFTSRYEILDSWLQTESPNVQKIQLALSEDEQGIFLHQFY